MYRLEVKCTCVYQVSGTILVASKQFHQFIALLSMCLDTEHAVTFETPLSQERYR